MEKLQAMAVQLAVGRPNAWPTYHSTGYGQGLLRGTAVQVDKHSASRSRPA